MAVAVFNYAAWTARYPEFASVPEPLANLFFAEATLLLDNTDCSPVQDVAQRLVLLNMLTAHIAALSGSTSTGTYVSGGGSVGRVSEAQEGTVKVSFDMGKSSSEQAAYFLQTPYGALFWQLTARYRTARYVPAQPRQFDRFGFMGRWRR